MRPGILACCYPDAVALDFIKVLLGQYLNEEGSPKEETIEDIKRIVDAVSTEDLSIRAVTFCKGSPALFVACFFGLTEVVRYLVETCGAEFCQTNTHDSTALGLAKRRKHGEIVTILEKAVACPQTKRSGASKGKEREVAESQQECNADRVESTGKKLKKDSSSLFENLSQLLFGDTANLGPSSSSSSSSSSSAPSSPTYGF